MKKNILIGILIIGLIAAGIWGYMHEVSGAELEGSIENNYKQDFELLNETVRNMSAKLYKCAASEDQQYLAMTFADTGKLAATAQEMLTRLPVSQVASAEAAKYLSKTEDFCSAMLRKHVYGEKMSEDDRKSTEALAKSAKAFNDSLDSFVKGVKDDDTFKWYTNDDNFFAEAGDNLFTKSLTSVDDSMIDYPTMIYDGPFSDHLVNSKPKGLTGENVSAETVKKDLIKDLEGAEVKDLKEVQGKIPMYCFEVTNGDQSRYFYFSKQGGNLIMSSSSSESGDAKISMDEAREKAQAFLEKVGLKDMVASYHEKYNNLGVFNFCYSEDGIKCYSDLVKVQVSLSDGKIVGYEATGYYMNHAARDIASPSISLSQARSKLSKNLKITNEALAFIPTEGKNEILCYEFKGTSGDDMFIIYVDAKTGAERQIFQVVEADESVLVL